MSNPIILYESRFMDGTPIASSTRTGFSVLNINDYRKYTLHKFDASGINNYTINCSTSKSADTIGIVGHNWGTITSTVNIKVSADGTAWTTKHSFSPSDDHALIQVFTSTAAQWWRVEVECSTASTVTAEAGVILLGSKFTFEKGMPYGSGYDPRPESINAEQTYSKAGNLLGSIINYHSIELNAQFEYLSDTWIRNTFLPVWSTHLKQLKPFFWAWDITNYTTDVFYCVLPSDFENRNPFSLGKDYRNLNLKMLALSED